jgi:hypothetical protein
MRAAIEERALPNRRQRDCSVEESMTGLLRIVDAAAERDAELSRGRMTLGHSRADALFVKATANILRCCR